MQKYQIRKQATHIRKFIGTPSLENLSDYANFLGYSVVYDTENLAPTAEFVDLNNRIICITNKMDEPTATHLLAHAIGHVVLHHKRIFVDETPQENEANYFAKCLLQNNHKNLLILSAVLLAITIIFCAVIFINNQPAIEPIPQETNPSQSQSQYNEQTLNTENVVITHSGEKYHLPTCYHVRNKSDTITLTKQEAETAGYTPCKICIDE